jgi:hypothetical protein
VAQTKVWTPAFTAIIVPLEELAKFQNLENRELEKTINKNKSFLQTPCLLFREGAFPKNGAFF